MLRVLCVAGSVATAMAFSIDPSLGRYVKESKVATRNRPAAQLVMNQADSNSRSLAGAMLLGATLFSTALPAAFADEAVSGFEEFAAKGGVMKADPNCFMDQCGDKSRACFTNPSCLKGITCLGNCRGEQLCATQCFARFGSEKLNAWLGCTLEDYECVTTGVKQDNTAFYANAPQKLASWKPQDIEGKWYKVRGYSEKYDCYPCQTNEFRKVPGGGLQNDILFRVAKPDGSGYWQNNFVEDMANDAGPEGKASMTVEGKMFGLTFHEQWYVLGQSDGSGGVPPFQLVAYKGDTQQGPYEGAFVFTKEVDAMETSPALEKAVFAAAKANGLDPTAFCKIDNTCPANVEAAGVSAKEQSKDKLEWKDVFELTEWFRPGTLKKDLNFDPNKM